MKTAVHYLFDIDESYRQQLCALLDDDISITFGEDLPPSPSYAILVAGRIEPEHITASPHLRTLIIPWAGLPIRTQEVLADFPGIEVYNQHYNAAAVAEHALALALAAIRQIIPADRALRTNDWRIRYGREESGRLQGRTALVLGLGAIGRRIGTVCRGFEMQVIGVKRRLNDGEDSETELFSIERLPELLPRADFLFVALPLSPATEGIIGAAELALLPNGATVVNIARGPVVNEAALFEALRSGRIRAGLDVWYTYPESEDARTATAPSGYPFHELDNVVMTPHMAGHDAGGEQRQIAELAAMLNAAASGKPLPNRVDPRRGY